MFYVYGLIDPRDNQIHYVGITRNTPARRLASHITSGASAKDSWLATVLDAGFLPAISILQTAETYEEIFELESWWIRLAELAGWPITNTNKISRRIVRDVHGFATTPQDDEARQAQRNLLDSDPIVTIPDKLVAVSTPPRPRRSRRRPRRVVVDAA